MDLTSPIQYQLVENVVKSVMPPVNNTSLPFEVDQYAGGGFDLASTEGIAASTYTTITNTINRLNDVLEMVPENWAAKNKLQVYPFAGEGLNAFYNRKCLAFFYAKTNEEWFFTSSSPDIVGHELGHAILDAIRPDLWDAASLEIWAFHEAFGDIVSMLSLMQYPEIIDTILEQTGGDLSKNNIASDIGENFSKILVANNMSTNENYLRSGINNFKYVDPKLLPSRTGENELSKEPHSFSRIFFGAIYDIMVMIYNTRKQTETPQRALMDARNVLARYLGKAIQYAPASVRFFESMAKTLLWVDTHNGRIWHDKMYQIFVDRNIVNYEYQILAQMTEPSCTVDRGCGLSTICHSKKDKLCNCSHKIGIQNIDEFANVNLAILRTDAYIHDQSGNLISVHKVSEEETIDAAEDMVAYLKDGNLVNEDPHTPFEIFNGDLKRSLICCCSGSRTPLKSSPEYYKQYKPENNAGCCGKKATETPKTTKKIKRGCYIRYKVQ